MQPITDNSTAQLERAQPRWPKAGQRQLWELLSALQRHERLTVLLALQNYQCYALSQRMGELRALGWPVQSRYIQVPSGKAVAEYWL